MLLAAPEFQKGCDAVMRENDAQNAIDRDVCMIWQDLREEMSSYGAYLQSYEAFKSIYRFVERGLIRAEGSAHAILFSLVDEEEHFLPAEEREPLMKRLSEIIRLSLRSGDAYANYSSSQYVVMVLGTEDREAQMIAERIVQRFRTETAHGKRVRMDYIVNELRAANLEE